MTNQKKMKCLIYNDLVKSSSLAKVLDVEYLGYDAK